MPNCPFPDAMQCGDNWTGSLFVVFNIKYNYHINSYIYSFSFALANLKNRPLFVYFFSADVAKPGTELQTRLWLNSLLMVFICFPDS